MIEIVRTDRVATCEITARQKQRHPENDTYGIVLVEAAVLFDADWDQDGLFDAIWIVRASFRR